MYDMMREPVNFHDDDRIANGSRRSGRTKVQESVLSKADSQRGSAVWRGLLADAFDLLILFIRTGGQPAASFFGI
jgi:hypothetical protein